MDTLRRIPYYGSLALLAYMPFHIFLAQSLSLLTGGLDIWKVAKDFIVIALVLLTVGLILADEKLRQNKTFLILVGLTVAYGLIHAITFWFNKDTTFYVAQLASAYNNRLLWYALIGMGGVLLIGAKRVHVSAIMKIVLLISTTVCLLGLVQWYLPKDVLTHVGYGVERGVKASFFINEDPRFPRVMSTIRDPNSLGAFLLVPLFILVQLFMNKQNKRKMLVVGLLLLHGLLLLLTFSRAAWVGAVTGICLLFLLAHKEKLPNILKHYWPIIIGVILLVSVIGYSVQDTQYVRSVVFRIDDKNASNVLDSDEYHLLFIKEGLEGIVEQPLGHGPGTAGIVSIQNEHGSFLTENYYVQLAYEVGVTGLLVFLTAWGYVVRLLMMSKSVLGVALVASAGAYAVMALVMHLWSNEAVATQWWLLSGLLLAIIQPTTNTKGEFNE